jgi:hypothetical protein
MNPKILPTIMILLSLGACVGYAAVGDWRRSIYWLAAAVLTTTVTY